MAARKPLIDFASLADVTSARMRNEEAKIRLRITAFDGPKIAVACVTQPRSDLPSFIQLRIDRSNTLEPLATQTMKCCSRRVLLANVIAADALFSVASIGWSNITCAFPRKEGNAGSQ